MKAKLALRCRQLPKARFLLMGIGFIRDRLRTEQLSFWKNNVLIEEKAAPGSRLKLPGAGWSIAGTYFKVPASANGLVLRSGEQDRQNDAVGHLLEQMLTVR